MIREGILTSDDRVELLEGLLVSKRPKNPPHSVVTGLVRAALERLTPSGWHVDSQEPITLEDSEPEPDVAVVRGERREYLDHHPGPRDIALVVEVADASLQQDRTTKKRLYAAAGKPVYWIVNLTERQIEVYSDPFGAGQVADYRNRQDYLGSQSVPFSIANRECGSIEVVAVLP
jgi:Uma2 family endonuclease